MTWWLTLPDEWSKRSQSRSHNVFHYLTSEVTHYHFCKMLLKTQINPAQGGMGPQKGMHAGKEGSLGAHLKGQLSSWHSIT